MNCINNSKLTFLSVEVMSSRLPTVRFLIKFETNSTALAKSVGGPWEVWELSIVFRMTSGTVL